MGEGHSGNKYRSRHETQGLLFVYWKKKSCFKYTHVWNISPKVIETNTSTYHPQIEFYFSDCLSGLYNSYYKVFSLYTYIKPIPQLTAHYPLWTLIRKAASRSSLCLRLRFKYQSGLFSASAPRVQQQQLHLFIYVFLLFLFPSRRSVTAPVAMVRTSSARCTCAGGKCERG